MTDTPTERIPPAQERLGAANELIAQVCDPGSPLNLGERVTPGYMVERLREHLARESRYQAAAGWSQPALYGQTPPAVTVAMAKLIPWPQLATGGLYPGDDVVHPAYGEGRVCGFSDEQWGSVVHLVAAGHILVKFADGAEHWLPSTACTRPQPAAPCVDQDSPF